MENLDLPSAYLTSAPQAESQPIPDVPTPPVTATTGPNQPQKDDFKTLIKKYKVVVAFVGILLFAILALVTIWFIRRAQQPLAPTAPVSVPKAGEVCTIEYVIDEVCTDLEQVDTEENNKIQFRCLAPEGTDQYIFEARYSDDGEFEEIAKSSEALSPLITQNEDDYVEVRCIPCAGEYCASAENIANACTYTYVPPSPSPSPSPSPTPEPAQCDEECSADSECTGGLTCIGGMCREAECSDETDCICDEKKEVGFYVEKYHDLDGDGSRDSDEDGLDWEFEWDLNHDDDWREYITYESRDGRGGNISNLKGDDIVRVREKSKSGWVATSGTEKSITVKDGELTAVRFGNRQPPASPQAKASPRAQVPEEPEEPAAPAPQQPAQKPEPTPEPTLPQAGSTTQTVVLTGFGAIILLLGVRRIFTGTWL